LPANPMFQGHPFQKFHNDERLAVLLADLMDCADIGMVQSGSGSRFAAKAFDRLKVLGHIVRQELQGDEAAQFGVLSLVDHTHPAAAEPFNDAVVRDGLADHWNRMLRLSKWQVNERLRVATDPNGWLTEQCAVKGTGLQRVKLRSWNSFVPR